MGKASLRQIRKVAKVKMKRMLQNIIPDAYYLHIKYRKRMKRALHLRNPRTFNEKMQWLKLHDRRQEYTTMVDKYEAKKYVAEMLGEKYIIPTLGVWDKFEEIDFSALPNRFVLKCTHDSGGLVICRDKKNFDKEDAKEKINNSLKQNYFYYGREWPYKHVKPRIIAEQYMEDSCGKGDLTDYKFHCYSGEVKAIQVISNRYGSTGMVNDFYTPDWKKYELKRGICANGTVEMECPEEIPELIRFAKRLAKNYPFIRVDFYIINHHIYFGELTLYPASGFTPFIPESFDELFGSWIRLPGIGS